MDSKSKQVLDAIRRDKEPDDTFTKAMVQYYNYRRTNKCKSEHHLHAFSIHESEIEREILEALLLAEADPIEINEIFEVPPKATEIYRELFFDISRFSSKLKKIAYVENYPEGFGKELKLRAMHLGPEFVYFRFGNSIPKTESQRVLVKRMFMSSAYRAMEANFNPINSKVTKASVDHAKIMMKAYECIDRLLKEDPNEAMDIFRVLTKMDAPAIDNPPIDPGDLV